MDKILWRGNYKINRGFGIVSHNLIGTLDKYFDIKNLPVDYPEDPNPNFYLEIQDFNDTQILINCVNNYDIPVNWAKNQIFITACEGTKCSSDIFKIEKYIDQIWVPSFHCKNSLLNTGVSKDIQIIPNGVNLNLFDLNRKNIAKSETFRFFSVFRWTWRKAPEILIEAFKSEFKINEAELIIKTGIVENHNYTQPSNLPKNINIINSPISQEELYNLYSSSHVFVLPTRGEGWGLPFTEAGALEIPVIATNWGGQLDFLNKENATLIKIEKLISPPLETGKRTDNLFAEPSIEDLKYQMRKTYENYEDAQIKAKKLFNEIKLKWTWHHSAVLARNQILKFI